VIREASIRRKYLKRYGATKKCSGKDENWINRTFDEGTNMQAQSFCFVIEVHYDGYNREKCASSEYCSCFSPQKTAEWWKDLTGIVMRTEDQRGWELQTVPVGPLQDKLPFCHFIDVWSQKNLVQYKEICRNSERRRLKLESKRNANIASWTMWKLGDRSRYGGCIFEVKRWDHWWWQETTKSGKGEIGTKIGYFIMGKLRSTF
jgi:hypothetical protein